MPRGQAPQAQASQSYGQKTEQLQAQAQMPIPQAQTDVPRPPAGVAAQQQRPDINDAILSMAKEYDPGITPLGAPSQRGGEPVTAGLSLGAGPGPEIFSQPTRALRAADGLEMLSQYSGDDAFRQLADRIRMRGGTR